MLSIALPTVPFAQLPRKEWRPGQEKKPRLDFKKFDRKFRKTYVLEGEDFDSDDDSSDDDSSKGKKDFNPKGGRKFNSKAFYEEVYDPEYDLYGGGASRKVVEEELPPEPVKADTTLASTENPDFMDNVAFLLANPQLLTTGTQYLTEQIKKRRRFPVLISKEFKEKYFKGPVTMFKDWKEKERQRRMHYIYKEYEERVRIYDEKLKEEARKEIEEEEKAVLIEAYKSAARIKKSLFKKKNKLAVTRKTIDLIRRREREEERMAFNCAHLPGWAVERHREKLQEIEDAKVADAAEQSRQRIQTLQERMDAMDEADRELYEEDCAITAEVHSIMRRCGMKEGVLSASAHVLPPIAPSPTKLTMSLKHNVDFSTMSNPRTKHEHVAPFDADLGSVSAELHVLKARALGERGALCFAGELVRTQLPQLEILDLSNCEMQTRGIGRVLRGVKLAKIRTLTTLRLGGNHLTPRALDHVRDLLDSELFEHLCILDLRDNEFGEGCIETLIRMLFAGSLIHVTELHLQNNQIHDHGFSKLIRVIRCIHEHRCPQLERLGLERNPISAEVKRELSPLPPFVSV